MANDMYPATALQTSTTPADSPATTPAPRPSPDGAVDVPALVEAALARFVTTASQSLVAMDPALGALTSAAGDAVLGGGKRIRPTFAYWGWRGVVGPDAPLRPVVPALAALELLHAFALVHDDVMDGSATRRGRPTTHRALAAGHADHGLRGDAGHFGRSVAILVGDLCLVWADSLIAEARLAGLSGERLDAARHHYDQMREEAIAGQFLDVLGEVSVGWSVDRAMLTVLLKTASYTVVRPLHYGAALGAMPGLPVPPPVLRSYTRYGVAIGEAFQLRDDLLDLYGEPAVTGKPVGADLARGKPTVLLELARTRASGSQARELDRLLGLGGRADRQRLATLIRETGATGQLNNMIARRVSEAVAVLGPAPIDPRAKSALADLAATAAWRAA